MPRPISPRDGRRHRRLMEPVARERGIRIAVDARPALADADAAAIQQAAVNLLDNAIKFSPPGSTVRLAVAPAEAGAGGWVLGVADEGPGIPRALRDRAFERFVRLGDELRRETKGAGIGLSLVKHIAEGHGGTACIADAPGGGVLVSIRCPGRGERLAPPVADAHSTPNPSHAPPDHRG
ncbi:MAG: ATP-binding protein [Verrucomicrobiales bacterium]